MTATLTDLTLSAETTSALAKVETLHNALCSVFFERETEVTLLLLGLMAEEHVLLLGPHGTGKTALAAAFYEAIGVPKTDVFSYLLGKFTMPDEIFGPPDLKAMKAGSFERNTTGKLPEATVALLDEIFKSNSAILNALLTILNEKSFDNPRRVSVPLEMVIGLSNELPEDGVNGPLAPLYDRFLFRRWTKYIDRDTSLEALLGDPAPQPKVAVRLTPADVKAVRDSVKLVRLDGPTSVKDDGGNLLNLVQVVVRKLKAGLQNEHGMVISDRRWRKAMKAVQAHAVLHGRAVATLADLSPLAHCLWDEPEDAEIVQQAVDKLADPDASQARKLHAVCVQMLTQIPKGEKDNGVWANKASEACKKVMDVIAEMEKMQGSPVVVELLAKSRGYVEAIKREQAKRFGF